MLAAVGLGAHDDVWAASALREPFGDLRDRAWDRAAERGDGQDTMQGSTSETGSATVTWNLGSGGLGKQA
jgi:hypothetical protein